MLDILAGSMMSSYNTYINNVQVALNSRTLINNISIEVKPSGVI